MAPALYLTFETNQIRDDAFNHLTKILQTYPKTKEKPVDEKISQTTRVFEKGTVATRFLVDLFSIGVGAGGGTPNMNLHFYVVIEKLNTNQIVLATHGNDSIRTSYLQDSFQPAIIELHQRTPLITEWGTSLDLPKTSTASPAGFRKHLGTAKWLFLT